MREMGGSHNRKAITLRHIPSLPAVLPYMLKMPSFFNMATCVLLTGRLLALVHDAGLT